MIIRSPEPEVKILVDRDPIKTSFEEWAKPGHFSRTIAKEPDTTTWIWNLHADAHDFDSHTSDLEEISRKVFSAHFGQLSIIFLSLSGMYFHGARFSNYEAWLSDPTHIGPSAQVVWPIVGQEILNGDVGGGWFNSMLFYRQLEYRCGLSNSMDSFGPVENTSASEDPILIDMEKDFPSWNDSDNSSYSNVDYLVGVRNIRNFLSDKILLVRDNNSQRNRYSIYFDIENQFLKISNDPSFLSEPESLFDSYNKNSSYLNNVSKRHENHYMYDTKSSWKNGIHNCIESYLRSQICIVSHILGESDKYNDSYFYTSICGKGGNSSESEGSSIKTTITNENLTKREDSKDLDETQKYKHLWIECENCYGLNYRKIFKSKMNICEHCGYHLKMSSSDRIELSIDPGTYRDALALLPKSSVSTNFTIAAYPKS
ncbi:acetyl-coenzyme A carboxylase carboxyl transferase subunit beta, chloroplastic-like [Arachis hypogaea]|uniref:acetyl-coenzyme A carboxylase carboxyl transferase subunit beta, chloroplastic-like n=1 Tax=Arachis hypogaea TaxID=3818 RepID=UPI0010FC4914|nr:uncharacterized protein LOC114927263 [Arachis hypogaea]